MNEIILCGYIIYIIILFCRFKIVQDHNNANNMQIDS